MNRIRHRRIPTNTKMYKKHKQYRLPNFDYSANGYYFITICTKDREHHFGKIENQKMYLSTIGEFVQTNILQFCPSDNIANPHKDNPFSISKADTIFGITEWEILPNHIHLIVEIINNTIKESISVNGLAPLTKGSVSLFINHFKGYITKLCNKNGIADFKWQSRFHDRIIRDVNEYNNIAAYINSNVINWEEDDLL
jgi:putative transposase